MTELSLRTRPRALFLDAGDTLLFMDPGAVRDALANLGQDIDAQRLQAAMHPAKRGYQRLLTQGGRHEDGWTVLMRGLLTHAGMDSDTANRMLAPLRAVHDEFYFWRRPPDDLVPALVRAAEAGLRLAIISNSEGRLDSVLQRVGIREHFEFVVDSHLEGVDKPDPEIFHRALRRLDVAAEHSVYAGDIPEVDVDGSRAVGMHGVLVDAFGDYEDRGDIDRVASVADLIDALLCLPTG